MPPSTYLLLLGLAATRKRQRSDNGSCSRSHRNCRTLSAGLAADERVVSMRYRLSVYGVTGATGGLRGFRSYGAHEGVHAGYGERETEAIRARGARCSAGGGDIDGRHRVLYQRNRYQNVRPVNGNALQSGQSNDF